MATKRKTPATHVPRHGTAIEHAIVRALIKHLRQAGFTPHSVAHDEYVPAYTDVTVLDEVFGVDECTLRFKKGKNDSLRGVLLVGGNGEDIISDWRFATNDPDGFNAAMDDFMTRYLKSPLLLALLPQGEKEAP